ncbi:MAG: amidohydrolase family protein [candidate division Zixibacteria bacterium]|nr:amidohydrolase family protein [candidate division Zixibacteria bacterium]
MTIVDTHAHIYHPDEHLYPMCENPYRPPEGAGSIEHLRRNMAEAGVGRIVLVQTFSAYRWDNRLLADTARANRHDMVGVCNLHSGAADSPSEWARMAGEINVRGLRLEVPHVEPRRYDQPGAEALFETARRLGLVLCAHIGVEWADELAKLLERYPDVPVVLDHSAYLSAADAGTAKLATVCALSVYNNLHTKLTFGVTGSQDPGFPFADVHPVIHQVIRAFGPDRCMWGSDFPCELWLQKATYVEHLRLFTEALGLTPAEQSAILSETPMRVWFPG